jgi:hypothetical protein
MQCNREYVSESCALPSFDASTFLAANRDRRVLFIGDSTQRQAFLSLVCSLTNGVGVPMPPTNATSASSATAGGGNEGGGGGGGSGDDDTVYWQPNIEQASPFRMWFDLGWPNTPYHRVGATTDDDYFAAPVPHSQTQSASENGDAQQEDPCADPFFKGRCW